MIKLSLIGSFDGYQESKSYPGQYYCYVRPLTPPPTGFLQSVKCRKKFGRPEEAMQKIGNFAVLCNLDKIPSVGMGDKIAVSAVCWPVSRPVWSAREKSVIQSRELNPVYTLDGEIKTTSAKAAPPSFEVQAYYQGAVRSGERAIEVRCVLEEQPPEGLLRQTRVRKGQDYINGDETLGLFTLHTSAKAFPVIPPNAPVVAKGDCWPVLDPYWSEDTASVEWQKVPTPFFLASAINAEKAKASA